MIGGQKIKIDYYRPPKPQRDNAHDASVALHPPPPASLSCGGGGRSRKESPMWEDSQTHKERKIGLKWRHRSPGGRSPIVQDSSSGNGMRRKGTVCKWIDSFGFIKPVDGSDDIFCHRKSVIGGITPQKNDSVEFEVVYDNCTKKYRAENVKVL